MNQKIDVAQVDSTPRENEFASGFFPSLILLTVAVFMFIVLSENQEKWFYNHEYRAITSGGPHFALFPAIFVSGITITNGLRTFSGKALIPTNISLEIWTLASILVIYIIIPTVFFFNWRRRRIENKSISAIQPLSFSGVLYALSIILTISVAITAMMTHPKQRSIEHMHAIQSDKDAIIHDLNLITIDAYQYRLLPKELGGGQGKYFGFALAAGRAKTQNGIYTSIADENQVTVKAQSLLFPSGVINTTINEQGQTGNWHFEGVFN